LGGREHDANEYDETRLMISEKGTKALRAITMSRPPKISMEDDRCDQHGDEIEKSQVCHGADFPKTRDHQQL
jgi:hypothetical protein